MSTSSEYAISENLSCKSLRAPGLCDEQARLCSDYIDRERDNAHEYIKAPEREKVLRFLLDNTPAGIPPVLLSMPCIKWRFENLWLEQTPVSQHLPRVVGLEWVWGVMELGQGYMPRRDGMRLIRQRDQSLTTGTFEVLKTGVARWVHAKASGFLSTKRADFISSAARKNFANNYRRNTCIWLDFTSQLCEETRDALRGVGDFCNIEAASVPIAVTLLAARDCHHDHEGRVADIWAQLNTRGHRRFNAAEWWTYQSHGSPMLTVTGTLGKGPHWEPDPERLMQLHCRELGLSPTDTAAAMRDAF